MGTKTWEKFLTSHPPKKNHLVNILFPLLAGTTNVLTGFQAEMPFGALALALLEAVVLKCRGGVALPLAFVVAIKWM